MLNEQEYREYMDNVVFKCLGNVLEQDIYADIINRDHVIEFMTDLSARSVGSLYGQLLHGRSFYLFKEEALLAQVFKDYYNEATRDMFHYYGEHLIYLQKIVLQQGKVIKFIDMMPYNNEFVCYLTTYFPIVHPSGEVVAILSSSVRSHLLHYSDHLDDFEVEPFDGQLSARQHEIMFLLANDVTQEQIAQLLSVTRGTISSVITHQLCPRFSISGTNAKLLAQVARKYGFHRQIPPSLWRPALIVLNDDLQELNVRYSE